MDYGIYINTRNASWQCLIDCGAAELPVKPVRIAEHYRIECRSLVSESLDGKSGMLRMIDGVPCIFTNASQSVTRRRYTIMHELGHFLLGHLGDAPLSRSYSSIRPEEEMAADRFAADILMPACVLWGLNIHTAEDIAKLCNVSMQAAQIRAERMEVLYQRDKFLSHPLERQVYQQFQNFIRNHK